MSLKASINIFNKYNIATFGKNTKIHPIGFLKQLKLGDKI